MNINETGIHTILLITLSNLGDIILTTPVLEKLHDEFPSARIDVISGGPGREVFGEHPSVRDVMVNVKREPLRVRLRRVMELRARKYDLVVDLKNTAMPFVLGTRFRTSAALAGRRAPVSGRGARGAGFEHGHKVYEHLSRLMPLGIDVTGAPRFFIPVKKKEKDLVDRVFGEHPGKKIVVMNPGAKSHLKRWDGANFALLADRLTNELECRVYVVGNEDDRETLERFFSLLKVNVTDLSCRTTLGALSELMRRSAAVVTNDSAPLHVASAVNAPTVAIFGPTDEKKYGPLAAKRAVLKPDVPCRPCMKALCAVGPDEGCISRVTVEEVFEATRKLLML